MIITSRSLLWFLLTLITAMLIASAMVLPKWLIGPEILVETRMLDQNLSKPLHRNPSVGIYTRCKLMSTMDFHCGRFDLRGFATDSEIYPAEWKAAMFFAAAGFALIALTVACTLLSCCRQSIGGKSIHSVTGCGQALAGTFVLITCFLHPLGWNAKRVRVLCGPDVEPFYTGDCQIGLAMINAVGAVFLCFCCAFVSLKAESSNMRSRVRRRIEHGDSLVCLP